MIDEKEIKKQIIRETRDHPEKYFPVNKLRALGFKRYECSVCHRFFWSTLPRNVCGDVSCQGSYSFINKKKRKILDFIDVWREFESMFTSLGYKSIKRYPVIARWNPTMNFTIASIADFQPFVVNGDVPPPSEKLVIPQVCMRFNDIDNVGITGSHYTSFTMIGQHVFLPDNLFDQEQYFEDYFNWFINGLDLDKDDIIIHEDGWVGGGNVGPCLEFFSGGLELGNQVYHQYKISEDGKLVPLKLKVLDMGMGQERIAWFTHGNKSSYEVTMPTVFSYLNSLLEFKINNQIISSYAPYAGILNSDEVNDFDKLWDKISSYVNVNINTLKKNVLSYAAIASIADHSRTLLYALNDGAIPSNVGGGYNLRVVFRRMYDLALNYNLKIDWFKLFKLHADYLKPLYPELSENLDEVNKIIQVEINKYKETKNKNERLIQVIVNKINNGLKVTTNDFLTYYDRYGILPEQIVNKVNISNKNKISENKDKLIVPKNFFSLLDELHKKKDNNTYHKITQTKHSFNYDISSLENTKILYFDDFKLTDFKSRVIKIIKEEVNNSNYYRLSDSKMIYYVILDSTAFYPTSGGQAHDHGLINDTEVIDVFKYNGKIIHVLKNKPNFNEGETVYCNIDFNYRLQLSQHHTAVHIVNGVCRYLFGNHIWQAGASKTYDKARLDITHYSILTHEDLKKIEDISNKIINQNLPVYKTMMERNVAESRYGFRIYQGGFIPGRILRIVEIPNWDVEACGGTHVDLTGEVESIRILKSKKIQDGVIRIELAAGKAVEKIEKQEKLIVDELISLLSNYKGEDISVENIIPTVKELMFNWKLFKKKKKVLNLSKVVSKNIVNQSNESNNILINNNYKKNNLTNREIIYECSQILSTQEQHIVNTIKRFLRDLGKLKE